MAIETKTITVDPKKLTIANKASIQHDAGLKLFYQPRHDEMPDQNFLDDIQEKGMLQKPLVTKYNGKMVVIFGNRRVNAAKMLGWGSIKAEQIPFDPDIIRDLQVAENEQRVENSLHDKLHNILAYLKLDPKTGKPKGLSYEDVGKRFNYNHQTIRDYAQLATQAPAWLINAVDADKISYTEALKLVKANKKEGGDNAALKTKFDEWVSESGHSKAGKPKKGGRGGGGGGGAKMLKRDLITHWAYSNDTPVAARIILQVVLGDVDIEETKASAKGKLDWMTEIPKPAKKAKSKSEEETVEEEDLEETLNQELETEEEETEVEEDEEEYEEEDEDEEDEDEEYEEEEDEDEEDEDNEEEEEPAPRRSRARRR